MRASAPLSVIINQTNYVISERQNSARCKHGFLQTAVSKKSPGRKLMATTTKKKGSKPRDYKRVSGGLKVREVSVLLVQHW